MLNGREIDSRSIEVPAGGRATAEFLSVDLPFGLNRGEVRIDSGDNLPDDDRFYFSVERSEARHILFVHEGRNQRDALYFRTTIEAASESAYALDAVPVEQCANLDPHKYAFVVLSDVGALPAAFETALRSYVRAGGSLLVALGRESVLHNRVPVFDESVTEQRYYGRDGDRFQTAAWLDTGHPSILNAQHWDDVKFYQAVRISTVTAQVAARLGDDTPLLLEKQVGEGRVLVFASTFDNISNDFPLHASFVPFIQHTANYLARREEGPGNYEVGSYLDLRQAREQGAAVEVLDPDGKHPLSLKEAVTTQSFQVNREGFYEIRRANGRVEMVAVHADRRESDLASVPRETLDLWHSTGRGPDTNSANSEAVGQPRPQSLWRY